MLWGREIQLPFRRGGPRGVRRTTSPPALSYWGHDLWKRERDIGLDDAESMSLERLARTTDVKGRIDEMNVLVA